MKSFCCLFINFFIIVHAISVYALTPEEILLLKKAGMTDEKILEMHKKGGAALPQVVPDHPPINAFDWNEDGKKYIIKGSDKGNVCIYLNIGANKEPVFDKALEIPNVKVEDGESTPSVVDWNNDGRKDIIAGSAAGEISIFLNRGSNEQPMFEKERKLNDGNLDVGFSSSPVVVDWNDDGKKDLVVGNRKGKVFVFFNEFNLIYDNSPHFQLDGTETTINVSGYATPFITDWNNDGKFDVICGSSDGRVYIFINEGSSKTPKFGKSVPLYVNNKEIKLPNSTSVIALDWDDDGRTDLLVSNKEKNQLGMYLLLNTGTKEKPEFKELKPIKGKFRDDAAL